MRSPTPGPGIRVRSGPARVRPASYRRRWPMARRCGMSTSKGTRMAPPQLTAEQRAKALEKAALVRRKRAEVKRLLKTGAMSLPELLDRAEADPMVAGIKVSAVLASMPRTGKIKSKRLMERLGIADNRRVRGLGERQRSALLKEFI